LLLQEREETDVCDGKMSRTLQAAIADPDVASRLGRLTKAERWSGSGEFGDTAMVFTPTRKTTTAWTAPTRQDRCAGARR